MQGKGLAAPDPPSSVNMANLTRLSVLFGEADADRSREIAVLLAELGVKQVQHANAISPLLLALKAQAYDVLLCAEHLGGEDGVAILRAARKIAPATRSVLMRGSERAGEFVPEDIEAIELPFSRLTLQGLLHRAASPQGGLWCEVPELSLSDILQMYHQARRSITVLLSGPIAGRIHLEAGEIVDAEAGDEQGMPALSRLLEAETGLLRTEPPRGGTTRTILAPFQMVILEAAHKLDERRRDSQGSPMSGGSVSIPPASITAPSITPASIAPVLADPLSAHPLAANPASIGPSSGAAATAITAPPGSLGGQTLHRGPSGLDFERHDFITRELSNVPSEVLRPALAPLLQARAPDPESFLVPNRAARRRQTLLAVISVVSSLMFLAVAGLYFQSRLDTSVVDAPAADLEQGTPEGWPAEPVARVDEPPSRDPAPPAAEDDVAAAPPPSGDVAADAVRGAEAARPAAPEPQAAREAARLPEAAPLPEKSAPPADDASFELRITSKPSRASVMEDGRVLGKTPLTLTIPTRSVADAPREFLVRLPGFFPVRISRGASESNVTSAVVLYPRPPVMDAPDGGQLEYDPEASRSGNPRAGRKDLGIRLRR